MEMMPPTTASTTPLARPPYTIHRHRPHLCGNPLEFFYRVGDMMRLVLPLVPLVGARIGRSETNEVIINDAFVSRVHALLVWTPGGVQIRDSNSSNGTFVNGARISRASLRQNDVVIVGNTEVVAVSSALIDGHWRPASHSAPTCRHNQIWPETGYY